MVDGIIFPGKNGYCSCGKLFFEIKKRYSRSSFCENGEELSTLVHMYSYLYIIPVSIPIPAFSLFQRQQYSTSSSSSSNLKAGRAPDSSPPRLKHARKRNESTRTWHREDPWVFPWPEVKPLSTRTLFSVVLFFVIIPFVQIYN